MDDVSQFKLNLNISSNESLMSSNETDSDYDYVQSCDSLRDWILHRLHMQPIETYLLFAYISGKFARNHIEVIQILQS